MSAADAAYVAPWHGLDDWDIVCITHYRLSGERRIFVAMSKDGRLIKEEGQEDCYLWNRLWHKAQDAEEVAS